MAPTIWRRRWQDQVILLLGIWLFASPYMLGYPSESSQAVNSYTSGMVLGLLAVFDLYKSYVWAVVVNMLVGLWVALSPWVPVLADRGTLMTNHIIVGVAVVLLALWELRSDPELHAQWKESHPTG